MKIESRTASSTAAVEAVVVVYLISQTIAVVVGLFDAIVVDIGCGGGVHE